LLNPPFIMAAGRQLQHLEQARNPHPWHRRRLCLQFTAICAITATLAGPASARANPLLESADNRRADPGNTAEEPNTDTKGPKLAVGGGASLVLPNYTFEPALGYQVWVRHGFTRHLSAGVGLSRIGVTQDNEGWFVYPEHFTIGPLVEAHAFPDFWIDPWARVLAGIDIEGEQPFAEVDRRPDSVLVAVEAMAAIDFNTRWFAVGPHAQLGTPTDGRSYYAMGLHLEGRWAR
jgi:hypothetical protein